jgi:pimeloyl-ACP methyl ester carboxylesterase
MKFLTLLLLPFMIFAANAQEGLEKIALDRADAYLPTYVMTQPDAIATLILLPGGDAATGKIVEGKPMSGNFLSRSRDYFFAENFNVMVVYRASDMTKLDYEYRATQHVAEITKAIAYAKQFAKPVWIVGTSRGTVSGTAAAIALGESQIQGLVLTSSVTQRKTGAVPTQNLAALKIPVLVVHHKNDACSICVPSQAEQMTNSLTATPVKKLILIDGGSNPTGDPCEANHWHGYINYEKETVKMITDWIKNPSS